jgi:hypothetical protein
MVRDERAHASWGQTPRRDGVDRAADLMLRLGVVLSVPFVLLPGVGLVAVMLFLACGDTLIGHPMAPEDRDLLLRVAVVAVVFEVAFMTALRRSLRRGPVALAAIGLCGVAGILVGIRGIRDATSADLMMTLAAGVVVTGFVLAMGALLGMVSRTRTADHGGS